MQSSGVLLKRVDNNEGVGKIVSNLGVITNQLVSLGRNREMEIETIKLVSNKIENGLSIEFEIRLIILDNTSNQEEED